MISSSTLSLIHNFLTGDDRHHDWRIKQSSIYFKGDVFVSYDEDGEVVYPKIEFSPEKNKMVATWEDATECTYELDCDTWKMTTVCFASNEDFSEWYELDKNFEIVSSTKCNKLRSRLYTTYVNGVVSEYHFSHPDRDFGDLPVIGEYKKLANVGPFKVSILEEQTIKKQHFLF